MYRVFTEGRVLVTVHMLVDGPPHDDIVVG